MITTATRHLTASMVVFDAETIDHAPRVLLVHHNATGKWVFPGGHVDENESPHEAAIREVLEETKVQAAIEPDPALPGLNQHPAPFMVAEFPAPAKPERPGKPAEVAHSHIDMLYVGTARCAALEAALDEVSDVRWVHAADLNELDVRAEVPGVARAAWYWVTR
jgi:8-oxo-dGTP pyrophosphatase MutT (NUDIX family)